jgi:hypothetical protein
LALRSAKRESKYFPGDCLGGVKKEENEKPASK